MGFQSWNFLHLLSHHPHSGAVPGGRVLDLYDRKKIIMPCLFVVIVSIIILPFSSSLTMFIFAAIILGAGWAFLYPALMTYVMENAGAAQGPAMATFTAFGDLGTDWDQ